MKPLKRIEEKCWYFVDGKKINGMHDKISGDVTGIRGNVTGIRGDFDEIPMSERKDKPNVSDWVDNTQQGE